MKTITEYRPMIFSELAAHAVHVSHHRRQLGIDLFAAVGYGSLGLWMSLDTGFAPWQWQFWLMFAPLFIAGELAWRAWMGSDEGDNQTTGQSEGRARLIVRLSCLRVFASLRLILDRHVPRQRRKY